MSRENTLIVRYIKASTSVYKNLLWNDVAHRKPTQFPE